ncbi:RsiV family protein [Natronospora cellulosivora (SeqCode)]
MNDYRKARLMQESATYPRIIRPDNLALEQRINSLIRRTVEETLPAGRYRGMNIISAASQYDTKVNQNEVLSLRFENYYYPERMASGITEVRALTVNLITGKRYKLGDLFTANYQSYLSNIIERQIKEQDITLINEFPGITGREVFYLTEESLVIVYQRYELTPGYYGVLEFNIPYTELSPVVRKDGAIDMIIN